MTWRHGDMMIWWLDDIMTRWHNDTMTWWHNDMITHWHDDNNGNLASEIEDEVFISRFWLTRQIQANVQVVVTILIMIMRTLMRMTTLMTAIWHPQAQVWIVVQIHHVYDFQNYSLSLYVICICQVVILYPLHWQRPARTTDQVQQSKSCQGLPNPGTPPAWHVASDAATFQNQT